MNFIFLGLLFIQSSWASINTGCSETVSFSWVITQALNQHPDLMTTQAKIENFDAYDINAKKKINPEFEYFAIGGREFTFSNPFLMSEGRFWMNFQLGDKTGKRQQVNQRDHEVTVIHHDQIKESVIKDLFKMLMRLKQINHELEQYNFSLQVFTNIIERYTARKYLSPDQDIEASIARIARDHYEMKVKITEKEKQYLILSTKEATRFSCNFNDVALGDLDLKFPEADEFIASDVQFNTALKSYEKVIQKKQAELSLENAKAIPDLRIGPMAQSYTSLGSTFITGGVAFVLPLPLLDRNQGGRQLAGVEISQASEKRRIHQEMLKENFEHKHQHYKQFLQLLKSKEEIEKLRSKFANATQLFYQGRVSINLVIELQRQILEIKNTYHQSEMEALTVLLDIYDLTGQLKLTKILDLVERKTE